MRWRLRGRCMRASRRALAIAHLRYQVEADRISGRSRAVLKRMERLVGMPGRKARSKCLADPAFVCPGLLSDAVGKLIQACDGAVEWCARETPQSVLPISIDLLDDHVEGRSAIR
eukprot:4993385-Prymnesium_polylepis.1